MVEYMYGKEESNYGRTTESNAKGTSDFNVPTAQFKF